MSDTDIQVYPMMIYFNCWFHTPITHNYKFVNCPPVNVYILCKHRCGKPTMKMIFRTRFPMVFPHLLCLPYIEGPTDFRPSRHFATCRRRSRTPHVSGAMASDMFCFFGWEIRKVMSYDLRNPKNIEASGWCLNISFTVHWMPLAAKNGSLFRSQYIHWLWD
jgi:hypothetical protein